MRGVLEHPPHGHARPGGVPGMRRGRAGRVIRSRPILALSFLGLLAFALFLLVRPFLDAGPAYRARPPGTTYAYSFLVVAAFLPYAGAAWASRRGVPLGLALVGAALLHLILLPAALTQSQDVYAYLFYGKMWAVHGANPVAELPLRFASDPWFPWLRWPDQPSVYGPLWTILTGGIVRLSGGNLMAAVLLVKAVVVALTGVAVAWLARAAGERRLDPGRTVLLFGWNPIVLVSLPLGGHADAAVAACWAWALLQDRRGRIVTASLLLAAATLVKAYAGIALVVYLVALIRRRRMWVRAGLSAAALAIVSYLPFLAGSRTLSGIFRVADEVSASLGGGVELLLRAFLPEDAAAAVVLAMGLAVVVSVIWISSRAATFADDPWPAVSAAFLAYVAVTPWFLYWHQVGLLALAAVAALSPVRAAAYTFSGTSMLTASFGGSGWGRAVQTALRYGIPAGAYLRGSRRRRRERPERLPA
jgi:alpha-1,6-mannosyltransferase